MLQKDLVRIQKQQTWEFTDKMQPKKIKKKKSTRGSHTEEIVERSQCWFLEWTENDKVGGEWVDDVEDWHRLQAF